MIFYACVTISTFELRIINSFCQLCVSYLFSSRLSYCLHSSPQCPRKCRRGCSIFELTPSNLRRNTTKHGAPDKPCRRRAAATKTADPGRREAVREATTLAHRHQTTHKTRIHRATERIECARPREGLADAVNIAPPTAPVNIPCKTLPLLAAAPAAPAAPPANMAPQTPEQGVQYAVTTIPTIAPAAGLKALSHIFLSFLRKKPLGSVALSGLFQT